MRQPQRHPTAGGRVVGTGPAGLVFYTDCSAPPSALLSLGPNKICRQCPGGLRICTARSCTDLPDQPCNDSHPATTYAQHAQLLPVHQDRPCGITQLPDPTYVGNLPNGCFRVKLGNSFAPVWNPGPRRPLSPRTLCHVSLQHVRGQGRSPDTPPDQNIRENGKDRIGLIPSRYQGGFPMRWEVSRRSI